MLALYELQVAEARAAGPAYAVGAVDEGFVACDELGQPVHPKGWSYSFGRLCAEAKLPRIRLHDTRHSVNSLLARLGVPVHIRAMWLGHDVRVNEDTYTHGRQEDLAAVSAALTGLFSEPV